MQHDVTFANQTVRFLNAEHSRSGREVSGPPMIRMMGMAFAVGLLFALGVASTGGVSFVASIGVWWAASIAVLAIESALRTWFASSSVDFRLCSLGVSSLRAAF
jgi:hypothetical protein